MQYLSLISQRKNVAPTINQALSIWVIRECDSSKKSTDVIILNNAPKCFGGAEFKTHYYWLDSTTPHYRNWLASVGVIDALVKDYTHS